MHNTNTPKTVKYGIVLAVARFCAILTDLTLVHISPPFFTLLEYAFIQDIPSLRRHTVRQTPSHNKGKAQRQASHRRLTLYESGR